MKFIVFEGIDGAGKTTVIAKLKELLTNDGYRVLLLKEPSQFVRARLKEGPHTEEAKALLFTYDRCFSTANFSDYSKKYDIVIGDRSYLSTIAYQNNSGDFKTYVEIVTEMFLEANSALPDAAILLDIAPSLAITRMDKDAISDEYLKDMDRIRGNYLDLIFNCAIPLTTVVNANNKLDYVVEQCYDFINHVTS